MHTHNQRKPHIKRGEIINTQIQKNKENKFKRIKTYINKYSHDTYAHRHKYENIQTNINMKKSTKMNSNKNRHTLNYMHINTQSLKIKLIY